MGYLVFFLKFYLYRSIGCNPIELNKIYVPIAQKTTIHKNKENIKKKKINFSIHNASVAQFQIM